MYNVGLAQEPPISPVVSLPVLTDPQGPVAPPSGPVEGFFAARLREPRDIKFVRVVGVMSLTLLPAAVSFFLWDFPWWLGLIYVPLAFGLGAGRYTLMLHATSHRALFKPEHKLLNAWIPWLIGPLYGHTPTSFYVHHMGMHHPENNLQDDLSGTMAYRRDSFLHFMHYWARFFFFGTGHLLRYLRLRKRDKLVRKFIAGEVAWYLVVAGLLALNWQATLVTLLVPWLLIRWFMMCGNFAQHAFVDIDDPGNCYRNSTCLINVPYNHKCYNDGYHIVHHWQPALHWTAMPGWFLSHIEDFGRNDAIVFDGLGNNQTVWWCLMTGDYGKMADHLMDLPGAPVRSRDEKIAFLQDRVRRQQGGIKGMMQLEAPPLAAAAK